MKLAAILILFAMSVHPSFAQTEKQLKKAADEAVKAFTWDVEKSAKGTMMFLDVAYERDNTQTTEYLTLTVAKDTSNPRPAFISVIVPNNIVQSNGIFIQFSTTVMKDGLGSMELDKEGPVRLLFENCNDETCTARIWNGYAEDEHKVQKDLFQKFLDFDHVLFLVVYPDGTHKSMAVPLFKFKEQYKMLK